MIADALFFTLKQKILVVFWKQPFLFIDVSNLGTVFYFLYYDAISRQKM